MKSLLNSSFLLIVFALSFTACEKEDINENNTSLSDEETVEIIEQSLASSTYGMTSQAEEASERTSVQLEQSNSMCGMQFDTTIVMGNNPEAIRTYNYTTNWSLNLICEGLVPDKMVINLNVDGTYDTPRISSEDATVLVGEITNLLPSQENYLYNGSSERIGSQVLELRETRSVNSVINLASTDIAISKETMQIVSGTTTFELSGTFGNGTTFLRTGSITYLGNRAAVLETNGNTYEIQW